VAKVALKGAPCFPLFSRKSATCSVTLDEGVLGSVGVFVTAFLAVISAVHWSIIVRLAIPGMPLEVPRNPPGNDQSLLRAIIALPHWECVI
jgi:hypothetical protein